MSAAEKKAIFIPPPPMLLGFRVLQRLSTSGGIVLVNALTAWTNEYFGTVQGLCIALLTFIIVKQLDNTDSIRPRLLKRVCLLYCNQQMRQLFITNDNSPASIFSDILLALALASLTIVLYDKNFSTPEHTNELKQMLESLLYLYGSILDFVFQYGVLKITICAFTASIYLQTGSSTQKGNEMYAFVWKMAAIINANLLSQGLSMLIPSTINLEILQCLASTCILRMILPDMQYYLTYLAAQRLLILLPDSAPLFFCITVCLELLPISSRNWVGEMCFTYVIISVATYTVQVPFWGMLFILIVTHYIDYIVQSQN